jgi:hypothetical protein
MQEGHHDIVPPPTPPKCRSSHETGLGISYVDQEDKNVTMKNRSVFVEGFKKAWDTFHRYFVYILIAVLLGIYIGITASRIYYADKIKENIDVGGMVYKGKIYNITPK